MPSAGQISRIVHSRGWWLVLLFLLLCGCTASRPMRRAAVPPVKTTPPVASSIAILEHVQPSSLQHTTQVVLTTSTPVQPLIQRLFQPDRLVVDLPDTRLPPQGHQQTTSVSDGRLQTIQVASQAPNSVRVTLTLQAIRDYRLTVHTAPHRVTVALLGTPVAPLPSPSIAAAGSGQRVRATPLQQAALPTQAGMAPLIVLDPGHGGHDPGALGVTGLEEKTLVLQVAKELRQLIQQEMPEVRVILTREHDVFIPLAERARIANTQQAALFLSLHANASPNREASGFETWYLSFAASARAKKIAARENMLSEKQMSTLEFILRDMGETDRINQAAVLAQSMQKALTDHLARQYPEVTPRGVEGAPFVVLHRTTMPSVLIEMGFLTNPQEEARMRTPAYQRALAQGILRGLRQFLQTSTVAMR